jgi:hypothetical protein
MGSPGASVLFSSPYSPKLLLMRRSFSKRGSLNKGGSEVALLSWL